MKTLGLVLCLVLCMFLAIPAAYATRDDSTNSQVQQQYVGKFLGGGQTQSPVTKLGFKGGSTCDCTGRWQTNWGEMTLTQTEDNNVTGRYTHDDGKIEGTISGRSFTGRWSEAPTYEDPNDGGLVELEFEPNCNSFTGRWKYGTTGDWKENGWTGERTSGAQKFPE